jgi:hypothetical protein
MFKDKTPLFDIHAHPTNSMNYRKASGYEKDNSYGHSDYATMMKSYNATGKVPNSYVYHPYSQSLIQYTPWSPQSSIKTGITFPGGLLFLYR